jgi:hypothetical protein
VPRGGYKAGGGRMPKLRKPLTPEQLVGEQRRQGMSPLQYMLDCINDATVDPVRRDRLAIAAAPYLHEKPTLFPIGKKRKADLDARFDVGTAVAA